MLTATKLVQKAWNDGLRPPPKLQVWQWADANRWLGGASAERGQYRSSRTPYLVELMECLSPSHPCREMDFMKGSQIGGTEAIVNWLGYIIDQQPTTTLVVLPDEATTKEWSQQRTQHLVETTPTLIGKISDAKRGTSGNSTYMKRLQGGAYLKFVWASSAKKARSTSAGNIIADEVDGFPGDSQGEGDPVELLRRRFTNYPRGKFARISTPTNRATSRIERGFKAGDRRYYFVPCPQCGHFQRLVFGQLRWEKGKPDTVRYECIGCKEPIEERFKEQLLARGRWVATRFAGWTLDKGFASIELYRLENVFERMRESKHCSFHLSALYSPYGWYSWRTLTEDWESSQDNLTALKSFINTVLGETWAEPGAQTDWEVLYQRSGGYEQGTVPAEGQVITAGADVQNAYIEAEAVAWGPNLQSWSVDYQRFEGDTETEKPWLELEKWLQKRFPHASGGDLPIRAMGVDSGDRARKVYQFVGRYPQPVHTPAKSAVLRDGTVLATKGGYSALKLIETITGEDAARKRGGLKIVTIGTIAAKDELYGWLHGKMRMVDGQTVYPMGYCRFPKYKPEYFQGLCAEMRVIRKSGKVEYIKDFNRNEPLDIRIIARVAASLCGVDRLQDRHWETLEQSRILKAKRDQAMAADPSGSKPVPPVRRREIRSRWV